MIKVKEVRTGLVWERMWVVKEDEEWKVIMGLLKVKWEHKVNITLKPEDETSVRLIVVKDK